MNGSDEKRHAQSGDNKGKSKMSSFLGCMRMSPGAAPVDGPGLAAALGNGCSYHADDWYGMAGSRLQVSADGNTAVLFSGVLLNEKRLRQAAGCAAPAGCPAEQVLAGLYQNRGDSLLRDLNGPFIIAIADRVRRRLLLARDQHGQKFLFYGAGRDGRLWFSDSLPRLRQCAGQAEGVDFQALADYLALGYIPAPATIYAGLRKVPAGHQVAVTTGREPAVEAYWRPELAPKLDLSFAEATAEARRLLDHAVQRCLQAAPDAGVLLSGGIDSNVVLGLAARHQGGRPRAFTIGFEHGVYDERALAALAARQVGAEHVTALAQPSDLALLPELQRASGEPFADSSLVPTALAMRLAGASCRTVLTGDGGDELFGGYRRYQFMVLRSCYDRIPHRLGDGLCGLLLRCLPKNAESRTRLASARRLAAALRLPAVACYASFQEIFSPDLLAELGRFPRVGVVPYQERWQAQMAQSSCVELVEKVNELDLLSYVPDDGCRKDVLAETGTDVVALAPILDMEVTEFALRVPRPFRVTSRQRKRLLRAVGADWLPAELLRQTKRGFGVPVAAWLRGELAPVMRELAASVRQWDRDGWLNHDTVGRLVREHLDGGVDHGAELWNLHCLKLWLEEQR